MTSLASGIGSLICRLFVGVFHVAIIVPIGIIVNLPPLLYWLVLLAITPTKYNAKKIVPFFFEDDVPALNQHGKKKRPRVFFDGCAWALSFELGVCHHLLQVLRKDSFRAR